MALVKSKLSGSAQFDVIKASEAKQTAKPAASKLSMRERMVQMRKQQQQQQRQRPSDAFDVVVAAPAPSQHASATSS